MFFTLMQSIANPDKFGINGTYKAHMTEIGSINGDVSGQWRRNNIKRCSCYSEIHAETH